MTEITEQFLVTDSPVIKRKRKNKKAKQSEDSLRTERTNDSPEMVKKESEVGVGEDYESSSSSSDSD